MSFWGRGSGFGVVLCGYETKLGLKPTVFDYKHACFDTRIKANCGIMAIETCL